MLHRTQAHHQRITNIPENLPNSTVEKINLTRTKKNLRDPKSSADPEAEMREERKRKPRISSIAMESAPKIAPFSYRPSGDTEGDRKGCKFPELGLEFIPREAGGRDGEGDERWVNSKAKTVQLFSIDELHSPCYIISRGRNRSTPFCLLMGVLRLRCANSKQGIDKSCSLSLSFRNVSSLSPTVGRRGIL